MSSAVKAAGSEFGRPAFDSQAAEPEDQTERAGDGTDSSPEPGQNLSYQQEHSIDPEWSIYLMSSTKLNQHYTLI